MYVYEHKNQKQKLGKAPSRYIQIHSQAKARFPVRKNTWCLQEGKPDLSPGWFSIHDFAPEGELGSNPQK